MKALLKPHFRTETGELYRGDCAKILQFFPENSFDCMITDPPYGLKFMSKRWDYDVPPVETWRECLRVLKPGAHALIFAGSRTQHRMAVNVEEAGFILKDCLMWLYGSGFPKSYDVSKGIDKTDAVKERRERNLKFTAWMRSTGLTASRIDKLTNSQMGSHYLSSESQPLIPVQEAFEKLTPLISLITSIPDWVYRYVKRRTVESRTFAKREVLGWVDKGKTSLMGGHSRR